MLLWPVLVCLFHLIFYVCYIFWPKRSHLEGSFLQLNTCFIMYSFYVLCDTHFESFRTYQDIQQISQTWKMKVQGRAYIFIWENKDWMTRQKNWVTHLDGSGNAKNTENLFQMYARCAWALSKPWRWQKFLVLLGIPNEMLAKYFK